jgi:hypothetical protein
MYQWIGLGEIYRTPPYLMVKTMVPVNFALNQSIECRNNMSQEAIFAFLSPAESRQ